MKFILTAVILTGFIEIAVFGIFGMNGNGHEMNQDSCIAAMISGVNCLSLANALDFLAFHLNAFQGFSRAVFGQNVASLFLLLTVLALFAVFGIIKSIKIPEFSLSFRSRQFLEFFSLPIKRKFNHWLALHENSPAVF